MDVDYVEYRVTVDDSNGVVDALMENEFRYTLNTRKSLRVSIAQDELVTHLIGNLKIHELTSLDKKSDL